MDDKTAFRDVLSGEKKERKEKEHEIKKSYNEMKQEQKELAKGVVGSKKGAKPKKEKKHGALEEKEGTEGPSEADLDRDLLPSNSKKNPADDDDY